MMKLHGYWRSSASYRVRIALNLKGIEVEHVFVNLKEGQQHSEAFALLNPQSLIPVLELENGELLMQSLAIIEYLEAVHPTPALLPQNEVLRAKVRAGAHMLAADTAPLQNLRVLKHLKTKLDQSEEQANEWAAMWIHKGLLALELFASGMDSKSEFLFTDEPSLAECVLVPQMNNARRFGVDLTNLPYLCEIEAKCLKLSAFKNAKPEVQADAP